MRCVRRRGLAFAVDVKSRHNCWLKRLNETFLISGTRPITVGPATSASSRRMHIAQCSLAIQTPKRPFARMEITQVPRTVEI